MTDYPHWLFGVSQINRSDRALRELFLAAYYPAAVDEGEPATADRQAFTSAIFGDIFDVLVASEKKADAIDAYRALVVGGRVEWTPAWGRRLKTYVREGRHGRRQRGADEGATRRTARRPRCSARRQRPTTRSVWRRPSRRPTSRDRSTATNASRRAGAKVLMKTPSGDPLVTVNTVGRGQRRLLRRPRPAWGWMSGSSPRRRTRSRTCSATSRPSASRGEVEYLFNRNARGWVVTLINNRGVYKQQQGLAQVRRDESAEVTLEGVNSGASSGPRSGRPARS